MIRAAPWNQFAQTVSQILSKFLPIRQRINVFVILPKLPSSHVLIRVSSIYNFSLTSICVAWILIIKQTCSFFIIKMFTQSSQKKFWMFSDENDLTMLRENTNAEFIKKHGSDMTVSLFFYKLYSLNLWLSSFFNYASSFLHTNLWDEMLMSKI